MAIKKRELPQDVIDGLSPGVRDLVIWLNAMGFKTTDSGDGSNYKEGMECAVPFPMVAIEVTPYALIRESLRLRARLEGRGVNFKLTNENSPQIQATFDPSDGSCVIILTNVRSEDAGLKGWESTLTG